MLDLVFLVCTLGVIPFWLLLIFLPKWRWTQQIVHSVFPFTLFTLAFVWAQSVEGELPSGAGFTSLDGVTLLFSTKVGMLGVWIHFIVMDLFAGAWMVRDASKHGIRHLWTALLLIITFALAPLGLALYLVLRTVRTRVIALDEPAKGVSAFPPETGNRQPASPL